MIPLFDRREAFLLLSWLDEVAARSVPPDLIQRLKSLVGLWAS